MKFYTATVVQRQQAIADAVTLTLQTPANTLAEFVYQSGQYLTVKCQIAEQEYQRSYSLSSSPIADDLLQITVKRVNNGAVSNYLNDSIQVGDTLQISAPLGAFRPDIHADNHRTWYLFAAGSGITPLWSIAKTILSVEPYSYVYLLYGNRDEEHIIFQDDIAAWQEYYPQRLQVEHCLSAPLSHQWSALWKNRSYWQGEVGRIDATRVETFIKNHPPPAQRVKYLICGPAQMIPQTQQTLLALDVAAEDIAFEYFGNTDAVSNQQVDGVAAQLSITYAGQQQRIPVAAGQTLLQALQAQGIDTPYSCQSGVCGSCKAQLNKGKVTMANHMALDETELQQGKILTCQACAQTAELDISY